MLLRPFLPAAVALAGLVIGVAAPLRAAPSLQALQDALNSTSPEALTAVLEPGDGLDPDEVARRRLLLREQFPDANTTVKCLRWYATHLNKDTNVKMPIRPRKKIEKPAAPAQAETEADPTA